MKRLSIFIVSILFMSPVWADSVMTVEQIAGNLYKTSKGQLVQTIACRANVGQGDAVLKLNPYMKQIQFLDSDTPCIVRNVFDM